MTPGNNKRLFLRAFGVGVFVGGCLLAAAGPATGALLTLVIMTWLIACDEAVFDAPRTPDRHPLATTGNGDYARQWWA